MRAPSAPWPRGRRLLALAALAALTLIFHVSALRVGFSFDDGGHLFNAARLSPAAYFLDPVTNAWVSGSNIAPWNLFVYDINVTLFQLDAAWHHAHLVLVVAAIAVGTFFLLSLWTLPLTALLAAALFAVGAPCLFLTHEEMSGHYGWGLAFTVLALYGLVRALRGGGVAWNAMSAAAYLLAMSCKEVYVVFPLVAVFLPEASLARRLRTLAPHALLLAGYAGWRWLAFGGSLMGPRGVVQFQWAPVAAQFANIPALLFASLWWLVAATFAAAALCSRPALRHVAFALAVLVALLAPLLPVAAVGAADPAAAGLAAPDRYLLLPWWCACAALAVAADALQRRFGRPALLALPLLIAAQMVTAQPWRERIFASKHQWAQWHAHMLDARATDHLIVQDDVRYFGLKGNLDGIRQAARTLGLPYNGASRVINTRERFQESFQGDWTRFVFFDAALGRLRKASGAAELEAIVARLPSRPLAQSYKTRTMPKVGLAEFGRMESVRKDGDTFVLRGWVPVPSMGQTFIVAATRHCSVQSSQRTGAAGDPPRAGFEVKLHCPAGAGDDASQPVLVCLLAEVGGDVGVIAGYEDRRCARLRET